MLGKFVPGLDAVAPPLAGTSRTSRLRFLALWRQLAPALYSCGYAGLGYVFSHDLDRAAAYAGRAGTLLTGTLLAAVVIYAIRKLVRWRRLRRKLRVARITQVTLMGCGPGRQRSEIFEGVDHEY